MKYKVINNNDMIVGIRFENKPGHEVIIRPNTFVWMDEEDILYTDSVSQLFSKGVIHVEDKEMLQKMGYVEQNPNSISKKEIKEILQLGNAKMKIELSKISEPHAIAKVIDVIKNEDLDLSQSNMKIIGDALKVNIHEVLNEEETI